MNQNKDIQIAKKVLEDEIKGLNALKNEINGDFTKALEMISNLKGRVILSGMGKSGHIANKIAATFASTGTPAFFVHPSEASHGDLGMITENDAVIVISNSGESVELKDIVAYTKRFNIPTIAIVSNPKSTLAKASDIVLLLPKVPEACPLGMAPTTSTTMTLALGDCLAVCLLQRKGFTLDDFKLRHPGGKLGAKLLKAENLMHSGDKIPLASEKEQMKDVLITMSAKGFGCVCVVDDNKKMQGIITDGDLRRTMCNDFLLLKAWQIMTKNPVTISPDTLAVEALRIMNEKKITALFVVENKVPLGILHMHDCLRAGVA